MADIVVDRDGPGGVLATRMREVADGVYAPEVVVVGAITGGGSPASAGTMGAPAVPVAFAGAGAPTIPAAARQSILIRSTGTQVVEIGYHYNEAAPFPLLVGETLTLRTSAALWLRGAAGAAIKFVTD